MIKFFKKAREPVSSFTHSLGAVFSVFALLLLLYKGINAHIEIAKMISVIFFGFSLIALYSASGIYHYSNGTEACVRRLRKLDHAMIYVLIAGSYTPVIINIMKMEKARIFISAIWLIAIIGIILKVFIIKTPRWLTSGLYILMGWAIVVDFGALVNLSKEAIALLIAGGISYTVGGILYIIKKPNFSKDFGFHEIFHIFIMIGSLFHFLMVYNYLI